MPKARLLLLEDDVTLLETIEEFLVEQEYAVESFYDGESAQDRLYETAFDLLILDVNVPGVDGFALLQSAREQDVGTPAIFITSLNSVSDLEKGFQSGADDYLRKPFELKEMLIRIESLLKRRFFHKESERLSVSDNVEFDPANREIHIKEQIIPLKEKEARLLTLFLENRDKLLNHEQIHDHLWTYEEEPSDDALRTYIKNLRKIIGKESIVSYKRLGYRFTAH